MDLAPSSVLGLAAITVQIVERGSSLLKRSRSGSQELLRLLMELESFSRLIQNYSPFMDATTTSMLGSEQQEFIHTWASTLKKCEKIFDRQVSRPGTSRVFHDIVRQERDRKEIPLLVSQVETLKSQLVSSIHAETFSSSLKMKETLATSISTLSETIDIVSSMKTKNPSILESLVSTERSKVDIIFVHGLNGDRRETWAKDDALWPQDFLGHDLPGCQIWSYGYDAAVPLNSSPPALDDLAHDLLRVIVERRQKEDLDLPILFVAHSFGGLIVKAALELSRRNLQIDRLVGNVFGATIGIIFLGTPHQSSSSSALTSLYKKIALATRSRSAGHLSDPRNGSGSFDEDVIMRPSDFKRILEEGRISIVSFFETLPLITESGPSKIVEDFTALNHPLETIGYIPNANHLNMCKFQHSLQPGYSQIVKKMRNILQEGYLTRAPTFRPDDFDLRSLQYENTASDFSLSMLANVTDEESLDVPTAFSRFRKALGKPWASRRTMPPGPLSSVRWIERSKAVDSLLRDPRNRILCVTGPQGCGKTTGASSIIEYIQTKKSQPRQESQSECTIYFFVGHEERRAQAYREILEAFVSQLLDQHPSLIRHVILVMRRERFQLRKHWTSGGFKEYPIVKEEVLLEILLTFLKDPCHSTTFCVIDAVDEIDGSCLLQVRTLLEQLVAISTCRFVITYAQDWSADALPQNMKGDRWLYLDFSRESAFSRDLESFIRQQTRKLQLRGSFLGIKERIADALVDKMSASFTWVMLNLQVISSLSSIGDIDGYLKEINSNPVDLCRVYKRILARTHHQKLLHSALCFLTCAVGPMEVEDLEMSLLVGVQHVILSDLLEDRIQGFSLILEEEFSNLIRFDGGGGLILSHHLKTFICGLLNGEESQWREEVNFGLSTDYTGKLFSPDRSTKVTASTTERPLVDEVHVHERLASACVRYLLLWEESRRELDSGLVNVSQGPPFFEYASSCWSEHVRKASWSSNVSGLTELVTRLWRVNHSRYFPPDLDGQENVSDGPQTLKANLVALGLSQTSENTPKLDVTTRAKDELESSGFEIPKRSKLMSDVSRRIKLERDDPNLKDDILRGLEEAETLGDDLFFNATIDLVLARLGSFQTALLKLAIRKCRTSIVQALLTRPINIQPEGSKSDVLELAVSIQSIDVVEAILGSPLFMGHGNIDLDGSLLLAARKANLRICSLLLERGANHDSKDGQGQTPLHLAAGAGSVALMELLIEWGALPSARDSKGKAPIHLAAESGNTPVVRFLLGIASQASDEDDKGQSPLFFACTAGHFDTAEVLISYGSNPSQITDEGRTPLHAAAKKGANQVVKLLLSSGSQTDIHDGSGRTPLHEAAEHGWDIIVKDLLAAGADPDEVDEDDQTPLIYACKSKIAPEEAVDVLLRAGAGVTRKSKREECTALHYAAEHGSAGILKLLIKAGADCNLRDKQQQTPLHAAARSKHEFEANMLTLIDMGGDTSLEDENGQTPFDYAVNSYYKGKSVDRIRKRAKENRP